MRSIICGKASEEDSSRTFIDMELADAARAGDVVRFIESPFTFEFQYLCEAHTCIGNVGVGVAALKLKRQKLISKLEIAMERSANYIPEGGILSVDIFKIIQRCELENIKMNCIIRDAYIDELSILAGMKNMSAVTFRGCIIQLLDIDFDVDWKLSPHFKECLFGKVDGRMRRQDLPQDVFDEACECESFSQYVSTTNDIMCLDVPEGVRVLLTVIKKLYVQKGRARRLSALLRGLDQRARRLVPDVLSAVEQEGLAIRVSQPDNPIWKPDRSKSARAFAILNLHATAADTLVQKCSNID